MKRFLLFFICCLCFLCGCSNGDGNFNVINYDKAKELISNGAILVDVRSKEEYDAGHIEGAILMSVDSISEKVAINNIESFDASVIVYCRSGARSKEASRILKSLGYKNVYDLGSISNWKE